jgi:uncharacterized protein with gpF-like domain
LSWSDDDLFALQTVSEFVDRRSSASFKVWRTVKDARVRDSHDHAEGQRVRVDDYFVLGSGARCLFPLDGSLPVEDIVNCRCYLEYQ